MKSLEKFPLHGDPTKSSPVLREKVEEFIHRDLVEKEDGTDQFEREIPAFVDNEGETFYQLNKEEPEQFIMTKILKGIINVSDVIFKDGHYYSREINLDNVAERTSQEEELADHIIMLCLFSEGDHGVIIGKEHNVKTQDGKRALYDFHLVHLPRHHQDFIFSLDNALEGGTKNYKETEYDEKEFKNILRSKLFLLSNQISEDFILEILQALPREDIFIPNKLTLEEYAKELSELLLFKVRSIQEELSD